LPRDRPRKIEVNGSASASLTTPASSSDPVEKILPDEFHRLFNLNVLGLLLSTQEALKLIGPEGGSIINIGSVTGSTPPSFSAIYSATKGALDNMSVSLSKEFGARKIRINSLNRGLIEPEGSQAAGNWEGVFHDIVLNNTPLGRIGLPDDIGKVAVFLPPRIPTGLRDRRSSPPAGRRCNQATSMCPASPPARAAEFRNSCSSTVKPPLSNCGGQTGRLRLVICRLRR
jgi:NAD(P)-dependent dehydrogenase (short-subunit alcohol dehydrogenase family)